jgi:SAM-dependent methyltransferase
VLTIDYDRIGDWRGKRVLDLGCGKGRHSFEALKRGALVVSLDLDLESLKDVAIFAAAIDEAGEAPAGATLSCVRADGLHLPFEENSFDVVIASEVLEHVPEDTQVLQEVTRVLKPEGTLAVSVPRSWPERICWMLSETYHDKPGGHVRIYQADEVRRKLRDAGMRELASHYAHALHAPYWWIKCALRDNGNDGDANRDAWPARAYHGMLVWDMTHPRSPLSSVERVLNPVLGKSLVVYARKARVARA